MTKETLGRTPRLEVGDRVRFQFGIRDVVATIIEDRGNIGHRGRRLLRVRIEHDEGYVEEFEVAEEEVARA